MFQMPKSLSPKETNSSPVTNLPQILRPMRTPPVSTKKWMIEKTESGVRHSDLHFVRRFLLSKLGQVRKAGKI